jgi:hypothetical protein
MINQTKILNIIYKTLYISSIKNIVEVFLINIVSG